MKNLRSQIKAVCDKHPTLGVGGFGTSWRSDEETGIRDLLDKSDDIAFVIKWLSDIEKIKNITQSCGSSYRLKHTIEPYSPNKYIANGVFIVGALIAGFKFERTNNDSPNAYFNMSCKSIQRKLGKSIPFETGYSCQSMAIEL